mmetsp:Transcript_35438/g.57880  ORF Transcript_35438/g.57880 Transcript_35438/m.57880 type:complete len:310 (+) Transcript_35438:153-1082(+)
MKNSTDIAKALTAGKNGGQKYTLVFENVSSIRKKQGGGHRVLSVARDNNASVKPVEVQEEEPVEAAAAVQDPPAQTGATSEASGKDDGGSIAKPEAIDETQSAEEQAKRAEEEAKQAGEEKAKKEAEDEACRQAEETERRKKEEEEDRLRRMNGKVVLKYEMYAEEFEIKDGCTTAANIDEEYALSFVMPNCKIHLSTLDPNEIREKQGPERYAAYVPEEPEGTYQGLDVDVGTYYVYIHQDSEQEKKDREAARRLVAELKARAEADGGGARTQEGCSCLEGNPCADQYICKNWDNRFAVAKANGWKGF